jgi:hypothetical protein
MDNAFISLGGNVNFTKIYAPDKLSHASAIAPLYNGTIVAFYSGQAECHESQRVWIFYNDEKGKSCDPVYLEGLTGNPVFLVSEYGVRIIYSKFEKLDTPRRVEWWQYCSLWERKINIRDGNIELSYPHLLDAPIENGYLPRCNPITISTGFLLPLYRERDPDEFYGTILYSRDGLKWSLRGKIGEGKSCIQPTLWYENGIVHAWLRNFTPFGVRFALYSKSEDEGKTWTQPVDSTLYNANNSILAIDFPYKGAKQVLVVWNNDPAGRENLTLSIRNKDSLWFNITRLDTYGSYPAACLVGGKLHITWTTVADKLKFPYAKLVIKHVEYDVDSIIKYATAS